MLAAGLSGMLGSVRQRSACSNWEERGHTGGGRKAGRGGGGDGGMLLKVHQNARHSLV